MALEAGIVQSLSGGKFFVKDINGNTREIKSGDVIYENDTVFGDSSNAKTAKVEISLASNDIVVLSQGQKQLIDASLVETAYGEEELFFTTETALANIEAYREMVDVVSDLRSKDFIDPELDGEVTAGEEEAEDEEGAAAKFATRDANMVNPESDLNKNTIKKPHTQLYRETGKNSEIVDHGTKDLGKTPLNPFERPEQPIDPNRPTTSNPNNPNKPNNPDRPDSGGQRPDEDKTPPTSTTPPTTERQPTITAITGDTKTEYNAEANDYELSANDYLVHKITLSHSMLNPTKVNIELGNATATVGKDTTTTQYSVDGGKTWIDAPLYNNGKNFSVDVPAGGTELLVRLLPIDEEDGEFEGVEYYTITATTGSDKSGKTANGIIIDNTPAPAVETVTNDTKQEGNELVHNVYLTQSSSKDTAVKIELVGSGTNPATIGKDTGTVTFYAIDEEGNATAQKLTATQNSDGSYTVIVPAGQTGFVTKVPAIDDNIEESAETYTIKASTSGNESPATATGTILDKKPTISVETIEFDDIPGEDDIPDENTYKTTPAGDVNNVTITEGEYAYFKVSVNQTLVNPLKLNLSTENHTAIKGTDYLTDGNKIEYWNGSSWQDADSNTAIASGTDSLIVRVQTKNTSDYDPDEQFYLVTTPEAGRTTNASAKGMATILDSETPPTIVKVENPIVPDADGNEKTTTVKVLEGDDAAFKISLNKPTVKEQEFKFKIYPKTEDLPEKTGDYNETEAELDDYDSIPTFTNGVTYNSTTGIIKIPAGVEDFEIIVKTFTDEEEDDNEWYEFVITDMEDTTLVTGVGAILEGVSDIAEVTGSKDPNEPTVPNPNDPNKDIKLPDDEPYTPSDKDANVMSAIQKEGDWLVHKVTFTNALDADKNITIRLTSGTATIGEDTGAVKFYDASGNEIDSNSITDNNDGSYTVEVANGSNEFYVAIESVKDDAHEGNEEYTITASMVNAVGGISTKSATGIIIDIDPEPKIEFVPDGDDNIKSITDAKIPEGDDAIFTVKLNKPSSEPKEYDFDIADVETTKDSDYKGIPEFTNGVTYDSGTGKITVPAGVTEFDVIVKTLNDTAEEDDETFTVTVGGKTGTGTITDVTFKDEEENTSKNDPEKPLISIDIPTTPPDDNTVNLNGTPDVSGINNITIDEGEYAYFKINAPEGITLDLTTMDGSATGGDDYSNSVIEYWDGGEWKTATNNQITMPDDEDGTIDVESVIVRIKTNSDEVYDDNETFFLKATVINDDADKVSNHTVVGKATIKDVSDAPKIIKVENPFTPDNDGNDKTTTVTVPEGEDAIFKITLDKPSNEPQEYYYQIKPKTDSAIPAEHTSESGDHDDYELIPTFTNGVTYDSSTGKVTIPAGVTEFDVIVHTKEDAETTDDEEFVFVISKNPDFSNPEVTGIGKITEKPETPPLTVVTITGADDPADYNPNNPSATPSIQKEGDTLVHTVTLSDVAPEDGAIVNIKLTDGTATIDADTGMPKFYKNGTNEELDFSKKADGSYDVTIPSGVDKFDIKIPALNDNIYESDENYYITASTKDSSGDITSSKTATGTILDNTINSVVVNEGEDAMFTVKVSKSNKPMEYDFTLGKEGDTADKDSDYSGIPTFTNGVTYDKVTGKITVPAGVTEFEIKVPTISDGVIEKDEIFTISIDGNTVGTGTIKDVTFVPTYPGSKENPNVPTNGNDTIEGSSSDDVIIADAGGVKTVLEAGTNYNIAFILDVSGSMGWNLDNGSTNKNAHSRLDMLKAGLKHYIQETLIPFAQKKGSDGGEINLSFVTFSKSAALKLSIADLAAGDWGKIEAAINSLIANGNTNHEDAFIKTREWFQNHNDSHTNGDGTANNSDGKWENLTFFITDGDPTAKVSSGTNNSYGYLMAAKNEFDKPDGIGSISTVHAIGIGNMVKNDWLDLYDNSDDRGTIIVDAGTNGAPTKSAVNVTWKKADESNHSGAFKDTVANDGDSTEYISSNFAVSAAQNNKTYLTFNYANSSTWASGDSFEWKLQKLVGDEWKTVEIGSNYSPVDNGNKTMQTGILNQGTYRLVFDVADNSNNSKDYAVTISNMQLNTSDGKSDNITGAGGKADIVMTPEQLHYALEAGGLYPDKNDVGDDTIYGGAGNDIIFGDAINTDFLEWSGRNHGAANSPDADGSGVAALKKYLELVDKNPSDFSGDDNALVNGELFTLVDSTKGVQPVDIYNYIKANYELFYDSEAERGGDDILFGDDGDDILVGGAGEDKLYGGAGNDILVSDLRTEGAEVKGDIVLDGGAGIDTLILEQDFNIDFSILDSDSKNIADRIQNIEIIDLTKGNHKLENLKLSDVLAMTDDNNELIIKGDGDDKVSFANDGNTWTKGSVETIDGKTFDIYENSGDSSVKVKVEVTITDQAII